MVLLKFIVIHKNVNIFYKKNSMANIISYNTDAEDQLESFSVSQQAGEICPTITATFLISTEQINDPPPSMSVNIVGITFNGEPHKSSYNINSSGKNTRTITYIHPKFKQLLNGIGQDFLFISCPKHVFDAMKFNEQHLTIKVKTSDAYGNNGWNIKSIINEMFAFIGLSVVINIPTYDVGSTTVQYQAGSDIAQFIQSLLPTGGDLKYTWSFNDDENLEISLLSTYGTENIETNIPAVSLSFSDNHQEDYTAWRITGGQAKPILSEYKNIDIVDIEEKEEIETTVTTQSQTTITLDPPEGETVVQVMNAVEPIRANISTTLIKKTTRLYDFKGDEFHVSKQEDSTIGAYYDMNNKNPKEGLTQKVLTTYNYENDNPIDYEKSRLLGNKKTMSGIVTKFYSGSSAIGAALNGKGPAYFLLEDSSVVTPEEYDEAWPDVEPIIIGAIMSWLDDYRVENEQLLYVDEKSSTKEYPEGTIKKNSTSITEYCFQFIASGFGTSEFSRWYSCTEDGKSILEELVSLIEKTEERITTNFPNVDPVVSVSVSIGTHKLIEIFEKNIIPQTTKGTYRWKEIIKKFNLKTGVYDLTEREVPIPGGRIPSEPTSLRKQDLVYENGDMGEKKIVKAFTASLDTNNREHFDAFCQIIKKKATNPLREITVTDLDIPYFQGEPYMGGIVTGWEVSATPEGKHSINIKVEV